MARTGRPSKYDKDRHPELAHWMAKAGLTDEEISENLGIGTTTYYRWITRHDEFREAIKDAKATPDLRAEQSLYQRVTGYEYTETRTYGKVRTVEGKQEVVAERIETIKKHVMPDVMACLAWLCNRTDRWKRNPDGVVPPADGTGQTQEDDLVGMTNAQLEERVKLIRDSKNEADTSDNA